MSHKWTIETGPRQTRKVQKALNCLRNEGKSYTELTGIKGKPETEHRCGYMSLMSPMRDEAQKKYDEIGEQFGWVVTRANYQALIEAFDKGTKELFANRPVIDNRKTQEEQDEITERRRKLAQEREERKKKRECVTHISCADTAKLIRAQLKKKWLGQKFSVRKRDYNAIEVSWTDGPTEKAVNEVVMQYKGGGFDGTIDMEYYNTSWLLPDGTAQMAHRDGTTGSVSPVDNPKPHPEAKRVQFGATYIFTQRSLSEKAERELAEIYKEKYGKELDKSNRDDYHWRNKLLQDFDKYERKEEKAEKKKVFASGSGFSVRQGLKEGYVEVLFPEKPDAETIRILKGAKFRFSRKGGEPRWWGRESNLPERFKTQEDKPEQVDTGDSEQDALRKLAETQARLAATLNG